MEGYNNTKIPFVDLEEAGLVVFSSYEKLKDDLLVGVAKSRDKFFTGAFSGENTVLHRLGAPDLVGLCQYITNNPSHPDHKVVTELGFKNALEFLKFKYRTIYVGTSYHIQSHDRYFGYGDAQAVKKRDGSENFDFIWAEIRSWNLFSEVGRMVFFMNEHASFTPIHSDGKAQTDFVWIPLTPKKFFVFDEDTKEKHYVTGRISTFNGTDFHGSDPSNFAQLSLRIDGVFKPEVTSRLAELCSVSEQNRSQ